MPRSYPPPLLTRPDVEPFELDAHDRKRLARVLGLATLPPAVVDRIVHDVACYRATKDGSPDTSVGATLAALKGVLAHGRGYEKAVALLADHRSGVDYTTLDRLMPLAGAVIRGDLHARGLLDLAARKRATELRDHPRVDPATEALRWFCGRLRKIYDECAGPASPRTWAACGLFALAALSISGVEHADFESHPDRLKEYLGTDVSVS